MGSKFRYQGRGSPEVKLGGKCEIGTIWKVKVQLQPNFIHIDTTLWTFTSMSGWGLAQLRFLSYFSASFYDIGVPWKFMCLFLGSDRTYAAQTLWGSEDWSNFVWELFFYELSWYWSSGEFGKFICPAGLFSEVASARCPKSVHGWARLGSA